MNWEAIGAIAEISGALAVFLSLIYLAIQTRNNTRALRSAAFHQVRESFSDVSLTLAQNPVMGSMVNRAIYSDEHLSDEEIVQFHFFLTTFLRRGESAFFQSSDGALQMETWQGIKETILVPLSSVHGKAWWQTVRGRFTPDYTAALDGALNDRT
jgi:hypothetical protein